MNTEVNMEVWQRESPDSCAWERLGTGNVKGRLQASPGSLPWFPADPGPLSFLVPVTRLQSRSGDTNAEDRRMDTAEAGGRRGWAVCKE